ncbi:helix-turn-helix domain-containing protein [Hymenobacter sp. PAMC 26628]|uniref:helix-turn-helix domain-containing protein n=1 Tax=Hymenobacter sp. PAMC 26628 TaxID=1484118 RepID=UPI0007703B2C|nr:helix-turn-helix transcriptional regulator [Hymenobacter sp. PAMC 26628]AMJ64376.1 hypothetical protein AXW84_02250 [Hymenobacter sp. PAMC 26628]
METRLTLADVHQQHGRNSAAGQVLVYRLEDVARPVSFPHQRRDFYKIKLLCSVQGILGYADQQVAVQDCALILANPLVAFSWERLAGHETGFACLFTEEFLPPALRPDGVAGSPLFRVGGSPVLFPAPAEVHRLSNLFAQLLAEAQSSYVNKNELLRNYLQIILHELLKLEPAAPFHRPGTSAARLSAAFLELLDRQFPIASPQHTLPLKNANEFAQHLAVHTNHLNKALKDVTGKTTTAHIAEKVAAEAKALLRHSDWTLAEIGYCLGFGHAPNFNSFFKKRTGQAPNQYRRQPVVVS